MGLLICFFYIRYTWNKYNADPMFPLINELRNYSILSPYFPYGNGFWSLKWKVIRHALVFVIFATIIRLTDNRILESVLTTINLLYVLLAVNLQRERTKLYKEELEGGYPADIYLLPILRACKVVTIYTVFLQIALYVICFIW